jgi:hypothetical protein
VKPVVLDSSALIAFCDPADPAHADAADSVALTLRAGHPLVVPVSALSEVMVGAYRMNPITPRMSHAVHALWLFMRQMVSDIYPADYELAEAAARYRVANPGLPLHAALVLATVDVTGADHVLTTELAWRAIRPDAVITIGPGSDDD